ncbi:MAG: hypothetical protein SGI98_07705 [Verrucomicrobiota bacterium]|nr:hypothetical protein [Verrucomicrobiota bacterium]
MKYLNQVKVALFVTLTTCFLFNSSWAGSGKPKVSVRVHVQVDKGQMRAIPIQLSNPEQTIYLSQFSDVTERDIADVHIYSAPQSPGAKVQLDRRGTLSLDSVTTANLGRLMVIFVNERPVFAEVIKAPIKDGVISFENIYIDEADYLRKKYGKEKAPPSKVPQKQ